MTITHFSLSLYLSRPLICLSLSLLSLSFPHRHSTIQNTAFPTHIHSPSFSYTTSELPLLPTLSPSLSYSHSVTLIVVSGKASSWGSSLFKSAHRLSQVSVSRAPSPMSIEICAFQAGLPRSLWLNLKTLSLSGWFRLCQKALREAP